MKYEDLTRMYFDISKIWNDINELFPDVNPMIGSEASINWILATIDEELKELERS